jgi:hypothetical protein
MSNRLFQCLYKRQGVRQIFALNQGGGRVGAAFMLPGCPALFTYHIPKRVS